jgi:putative ABC transport system permease protein
VTQDAVLATFDRILRALTLAVGGIAAISLGVAGILIMNVMLIAVSQRTREIGLLKAVGAAPGQIRALFFAEAVVLSFIGAAAGLALGVAGNALIVRLYPILPAVPPLWAVAAALIIAVATGVLFSILPARRAARLDPVMALSRR